MKLSFLISIIIFNFIVNLVFALKLFEEIEQAANEHTVDSEIALDSKLSLAEIIRPFSTHLSELDPKNLTNPLEKRQLEILKRAIKYPKLTDDYRQVRRTLKTMGQQRWSCRRNNTRKCNLSFLPHIKSIITQNDNEEEIKYYWLDWRAKMPDTVKKSLLSQVEYYQHIGSFSNLKPSEVWYEDYETNNFHEDLENIMKDISPLYMQLHAHIRYVLNKKHGDAIINSTGLIPAHLMESVTYQAWKKGQLKIV